MSDGDRFFEVRGTVQQVMFRQTLIRAMQKRRIVGGASNDRADRSLVRLTLRGPSEDIDELVDVVGSGKLLNDWGAKAESITEVEAASGRRLEEHQVTTDNVDARNWNPNVKFFI